MAKSDDDPAKRAKKMAKKAEALQAELAALQAEAAALSGAAASQAAPPPVVQQVAPAQQAASPATAPQQFMLQPTAAPAKQKGRGGLVATLVLLSTMLVASVAALALLVTGIITSPFDAAAPVAQATGTPTTTYFAPAGVAGANAFTAVPFTLAPDASAVLPATMEVAGAEASAPPVPTAGDQTGLYGLGPAGCTRDAFAEDLAASPEKAAAWVSVLNDDPTLGWGGELVVDDIKKYLYNLTGLTLVSDTWVMDHGYAEGASVATPLLLQKGTAVFVDLYGAPRVRCLSGNPLTAPAQDAAPVFSGTAWEDFLAEAVVAVEPTTAPTVQYQVRLPATLTGTPVPLLPYPCSWTDNCAAPSSAYVVPDLSVVETIPAGVTLPTAAICSDLPSEDQLQYVPARLYNASSELRHQFWVSNSSLGCEVQYMGTLKPLQATNGGLKGARVGDAFLFTDGSAVGEDFLVTDQLRVWTIQ